jgi:hypothetical protein
LAQDHFADEAFLDGGGGTAGCGIGDGIGHGLDAAFRSYGSQPAYGNLETGVLAWVWVWVDRRWEGKGEGMHGSRKIGIYQGERGKEMIVESIRVMTSR